MPFDASYAQLLRLLATRGLEWLRQRVTDLADPLPLRDEAISQLSMMAQIAPVLSGLRGHASPLEDIVSRRMTLHIVHDAANNYLAGRDDRTTLDCILGGQLVAAEDPIWQLAIQAIAHDPERSPMDRLAAGAPAEGDLLDQIESEICKPIPAEILDEAKIDKFAWSVMQLYQFGAVRPEFSHPRIYGDIFTKLGYCAQWALKNGQITAMCQVAYCLRLIDPDHDIGDLIADVISHQRPDGSFPRKSGYSSQDQTLSEGTWPTLMALSVLKLAACQKWHGPTPDHRSIRPFTTSRNSYAAAIAPLGKEWAAKANGNLRLKLACGLSRATNENWFLRLGLSGFRPTRTQILSIASQLYGDIYAARNARKALNLEPAWPSDLENGNDAAELRWLRGAPVRISLAETSEAQAREYEATDFDTQCINLIKIAHEIPDAALKAQGLRHAWQALLLLEQGDGPQVDDVVAHLERLNRMVQIFESEPFLPAAA